MKHLYGINFSDSLEHHGIKGQKWGVRNGPPYPIEQGMKKGTRLNNVSIYKNGPAIRKRNGIQIPVYTYNKNQEWDNKVYKGPFAKYLQSKYPIKLPIYETEYETTKDFKMPTQKERLELFENVYNKKKFTTVRELKEIQSLMKLYNIGSKDAQLVNVKKLKTEEDYKAAYEVFNHNMEAAFNFKSTREYLKLAGMKWDAMVDDNNQGVYNEAKDPVIILDPKNLKYIKSTEVPYSVIEDSYQYVKKELEKKGKRVAL